MPNNQTDIKDITGRIIRLNKETFEQVKDIFNLYKLLPGATISWNDDNNQYTIIYGFNAKTYKETQCRKAGRPYRRNTSKYQEFLELLSSTSSKKEIMTTLGISESTYYRYKRDSKTLPIIQV